MATISSGLCPFFAISVLLRLEAIPQDGALQWGGIKTGLPRKAGPTSKSLFGEGGAFGNTGVAYLGVLPKLFSMACDSQTSASDVIPTLEGLTVADLDKVIAEAERQRETRRESGKKELVEEFRAKAEALGLSLEEVLGKSVQTGRSAAKASQTNKSASAASPSVKYRNSASGETWSGRGRMPKWMALAVERGRNREEFLAKG